MPGVTHTQDDLTYSFFPLKKYSANITVRAAHNAHICLAPEASQEVTPVIEIFIGGWENARSAIRYNREKPDKAEATTPFICNPDVDKNFLVTWNDDGEVSVSMDGATEPFLYWKNEEPFPVNVFGVRTAWGATGNWNLDGKELQTEDSLDYTFLPVFTGSLKFGVRAKHNAHVALTASESDAPPIYELFLGGWENSKSAIRFNKEKPDKAEAETPDCLDSGEFKKFWVTWGYSGIKVGRDCDSDPFLELPNPEPITVRCFAIRTGYGTDGYWQIEGVEGTEEAPPASENEVEPAPEDAEAPAAEKIEVPSVEGATWVASSGGELPEGALKGGEDDGHTLYVARCEHEGAIIPGKLLVDHGVIYYPWNCLENSSASYEVLVIPEDQVSWVATSGETIPANAIPGGISLEGETLYVGRAPHEGTITPGKVHPSHAVCYISYGGEEHGYSEYEILVKND